MSETIEKHCWHHQASQLDVERITWTSRCCYCGRYTVPTHSLDPEHGGFSRIFVQTVAPEVDAERCRMRYNTGPYYEQRERERKLMDRDEHRDKWNVIWTEKDNPAEHGWYLVSILELNDLGGFRYTDILSYGHDVNLGNRWLKNNNQSVIAWRERPEPCEVDAPTTESAKITK